MYSSSDERGWSPLHSASAQGRLDVVKWLAVNGANLNADTPTGYSPLHVAAMNGHTNSMMVGIQHFRDKDKIAL